MGKKRVYPHVHEVGDRAASEVLRLLWDKIYELEDQLGVEKTDTQRLFAAARSVQDLKKVQARHESLLSQATRTVTLDPSDPSIVVPGESVPGAPGSSNPPPAPTPGSGDLPYPGSKLSIIQGVASSNPGALANSCQPTGGSWEFMDLCVAALRADSPRWGYNCKRGNCGDISHDVVDFYYGADLSQAQGSTKVYIIDIIGGHCGDEPHPAWIDQTAKTREAGTIGRWKYPR